MKKIISLSFMLLLCLTLVTGCGKSNKEETTTDEKNIKEEINDDGTLKEDKNENKGVLKEQVVEGITLNSVELKSTAYSSTMSVTATNNTNNDITFNYFKVYFEDKDGKNILGEGSFAVATLFGTLKSKESKILSLNVDTNLSDVYSISYEMVK